MSQSESTKVVFGNWALRGRGHVIRLLLEHLKIPYEERIYRTPQSWYEDPLAKANPSLELPYLLDQDFLIEGPIPIINYVLRNFGYQNFLGESIEQQAQVDMHLWAMESLFKKLICLSTRNDLPVDKLKTLKEEVWQRVICPKVKHIEQGIDLNNWYLGSLTVIDFDIEELVGYLRILYPSKID